MAHTSTTIYSDSTYGVEIADMQAVVPSSSHYVGSIMTTDDINKWAKYKPTRMAGLNPTDSWKGQQKNVYGSTGYSNGIGFVIYESLSDLRASANGIGWNYERPRGKGNGDQGADEWFRFPDFDGYNDNAASPFISLGAPGDTYTTGEDTFIAADFMFDTEDPGALDLSDFSLFDDWYFGVAVFCNSNPNLCGRGTAVSPLSYKLTDNYSACKVPMNLPARAVGTCTLVPFFTNTEITWAQGGEPSGNHRYVPLPFGAIQITVVEGGLVAAFTFSAASSGAYTYRATDGRLSISFPAISATNTGGSRGSIVTSNIYYQVTVMNSSDSSTNWVSDKTSLGISSTVLVDPGDTEVVVASATSGVLSGAQTGTATIAGTSSSSTLHDFIGQAGGIIQNDYRVFVQMWYYNLDASDYEDMDVSFEPTSN